MSLKLVAIGGLGLMLSPSARHLKSDSEARFIRIHDRGKKGTRRDSCRQAWQTHGAELVSNYKDLIGDDHFDGLVICAGKNGDDAEILRSIIPIINSTSNPKPFILHLSTVSSRFVDSAYKYLAPQGIPYVNYPLTGGPAGADSASMLVLASGDSQLYTDLEPFIKQIGNPRYFGPKITAGTEVKLIGQMMVFNGLTGICSAAALKSSCFQEPLSGNKQAEFFDFLNNGAGGTKQWDVALSKGIRDNIWDQGFMLHHAVIDTLYTIQLCQEQGLSNLTLLPLLSTALAFSYLLRKNKGKSLATHSLVQEMTQENAYGLDSFLQKNLVLANIEKSLDNVIGSLPESLQRSVDLDIDVQSFVS